MKRTVVSLIAIVCLLAMTLSLVSCGGATLEDYKKNLGSAYEVEIYTDDSDMEEMLEEFGIDGEDVSIKGVLSAEHEEEDLNVLIFECGDKTSAVTVKESMQAVLTMFGALIGDGFVVEADGVFVFFGNKEAIQKAQG